MDSARNRPFAERLQPAVSGGGFAMEDWWIWGTSVVCDDDGRYQLFASRWSKDVPFAPGWTSNSHIVRATSLKPEGPYEFAETIIPPGSESDWDRMSHNPSIHTVDGTFLLYYYGCGYDGPRPSPENPRTVERYGNAVGLATAPTAGGPWTKHGAIIQGETNAVPVIRADGSALVFTRDGNFEMSIYEADHWSDVDGYRLVEHDVLRPLEDHTVWRARETGQYHLVAKDMHPHVGNHTGIVDGYAGFHATSEDGIGWNLSDPPNAYPHRTNGDRALVVEWDDGTASTFANAERAHVFAPDGVATHLFLAVMEYSDTDRESVSGPTDLPSHARWPDDTYSVCIPLC